jgi:hypothetical protein
MEMGTPKNGGSVYYMVAGSIFWNCGICITGEDIK